MPLYLKGHSYGEYIFDWSWADAWERSGNRYFPKLLSGVPFTPVTCRKLLVKQGEDLISLQQALVQALVSVTKQLDVSSLHVNFIPPEEIKPFETTDFLKRSGLQYHWLNKNYESFDDFLSELTSRKRKSIKKERKNALQNGIKISALNGNDIKSFHWDAFYDFYLDTTEKKWGGAYLNKTFFELIGERMSDKICLFLVSIMVSLWAVPSILLVRLRCLAEIGVAQQTLSFCTLRPAIIKQLILQFQIRLCR